MKTKQKYKTWYGVNKMNNNFKENSGRIEILEKVKEFYVQKSLSEKFVLGETYIPASGKVMDEDDLLNLVDASLDMWLVAINF